MFCPIIRSECREDCACISEGECAFANTLRAFECVDPGDLATAVEYVAGLADRNSVDLYVGVVGGMTAYSKSTYDE